MFRVRFPVYACFFSKKNNNIFFYKKINDKEGIRTLASGDIALAGQPIKTTLAPYQNICYFLYIGCIYDVIYKEISCKINIIFFVKNKKK